MRLSRTTIATLMLAGISMTQNAQAETVGVVGMFYAEEPAIHHTAMANLEQQVSDQGCTLRREGNILANDGDYEIEPVNHFFFLECEQRLLSKPSSQSWIDELNEGTGNLVLFEGSFINLDSSSISLPGEKRSYILKLSDYNNTNPSKREADLARLDEMVKTRQHKYSSEAYLNISAAYGMERPDEAVFIFYPSMEDGEKFRNDKNNADIMAGIEAFNRDHLSQFSYFVATSNR